MNFHLDQFTGSCGKKLHAFIHAVDFGIVLHFLKSVMQSESLAFIMINERFLMNDEKSSSVKAI